MTVGDSNHNMNTTPHPHNNSESETDVRPMNTFTFAQLAGEHIEQLKKSERGAAALRALAELLRNDGTWSLDAWNQEALSSLLAMSIVTPSIRELVIDSVRVARIH
jgi:hypothetical protein